MKTRVSSARRSLPESPWISQKRRRGEFRQHAPNLFLALANLYEDVFHVRRLCFVSCAFAISELCLPLNSDVYVRFSMYTGSESKTGFNDIERIKQLSGPDLNYLLEIVFVYPFRVS